MMLWLSVAGVCLLTALAITRLLDRAQRARRDADWGDWPPDQMAQ